jgi:hypothetical protein
MVSLAERSARTGEYAAIAPLERAHSALESGGARNHSLETIERFEAAVDALQAKESADWPSRTAGLFGQHPAVVSLIGVFALYMVWLAVLRFVILKNWPLTVLKWGRTLAGNLEAQAPQRPGKGKLALRSLILAGLDNHPLVLDAWVAQHATAARDRFLSSETVQARSTYVPIPLLVNGKPAPLLDFRATRALRGRDRWLIVISGEDGLGKTTLACRLALLGLADDPAERLEEDIKMLPVFIEPGSSCDVCKDAADLEAAVKNWVRDLVEPPETVPDEFVARLLRTRRILVLLDGVPDGVSRLDGSAGFQVPAARPLDAAPALVVTTRERLPGATVLIEPQLLDRNHLLPFLSAYLARADLGALPDATIYHLCARLADMVGQKRGVTPVLARTLVEEVAAAVRDGRSPLDLPESIANAMLS